MYICAKCNTLVEQPKKKWWSGWRYCPNDHVLYVWGFGPSLEQSFRKSFLKAFVPAMIISGWIVLAVSLFADDARARSGAPDMGFVVAIFCSLFGLNPLRKAHVWAGRAGPVQRLVAHARGRAYGFLAAALCQLGITVASLFLK